MATAARTDPVTGLPNRSLFLERLTAALDGPAGSVAVLFLDLDRFKWINDSLGHPAGDKILVEVAARIRCLEGEGYLVARFGGDEFAVLLTEVTAAEAAAVARRIEVLMSDPFELDGGEFFLSASIGLAMNDHPADAFGLVRDADTAMYQAKEAGRARHVLFDGHLRERVLQRVRLEAELRRGISRDEFVVHLQPVADFGSRAWVGVEALVRWQHPERGLVGPDAFIPLAEETGLIVPLGLKILDLAVAEAARLGQGDAGPYVAANVSAVQLADPSLAFDLAAMLSRHHVDPGRLVIEITETALMEQPWAARTTLERLQALGVRIFIDDFGTGHSSIARLAELPVGTVKVDRRFTVRLAEEERAGRVLGAVIDLAHAHDLAVVAEGIEDAAACALAMALGCEAGQGYWLGRPAPPGDAQALLTAPPRLPEPVPA